MNEKRVEKLTRWARDNRRDHDLVAAVLRFQQIAVRRAVAEALGATGQEYLRLTGHQERDP